MRSTSGLNEPDARLAPTAQTIAAPGLVATELRASEPTSGLATVVHAVPFRWLRGGGCARRCGPSFSDERIAQLKRMLQRLTKNASEN